MTVPVDIRLLPGTFTPDSPSDAGDRSWWIPVGSQMHTAVRDSVRQARAQGLEAGAHVTVTLAGTEPAKTRGLNDKKIYAVEYKAPSPGNAALMGDGASAAVAQPA